MEREKSFNQTIDTEEVLKKLILFNDIDVAVPNLSGVDVEDVVIGLVDMYVIYQIQSRSFQQNLHHYDFKQMPDDEKYLYQMYALFKTIEFDRDLYFYWKKHIIHYMILNGMRNELSQDDMDCFLSIGNYCCNANCSNNNKETQLCECGVLNFCSQECKHNKKECEKIKEIFLFKRFKHAFSTTYPEVFEDDNVDDDTYLDELFYLI
jgi:hypothetical protein